MGKPLLSDEILEKAARGEDIHTDYPYEDWDSQETKVIPIKQESTPYLEDTIDLAEDNRTVKSRRIENARRGQFQSKLNKILIILLILVAILVYAAFNL
ncbi:cell wall synthase accessory phosphoprotein MacP [Streptococcus caprae]|uniref:Cell wall synthase accessory phosphoprotein MacP n=1 Tax=Streptococcus caprae TaxID=1640501 RepID=A0ABV8CUP3_9STRE